jgi:hypothetical protein
MMLLWRTDVMKRQHTMLPALKGGLIIIAAAAVPLLSACSSHRHSSVTTTETRVEYPDSEARYRINPEAAEVETTSTKTQSSERSGGGLFSIIFDIIALPFRALAAIF